MSKRPVFCATHPRACSTAFERVFMTQRDTLQCVHEPLGDAFYYGPERMSSRFENDESTRAQSGFSASTYQSILDRIEHEGDEGKRVFIKDITYYLFPPEQQKPHIAPSLIPKRGVGTEDQATESDGEVKKASNDTDSGIVVPESPISAPFPYTTHTEQGNPTVVPRELLEKFHFTFLIRHPKNSIPSYYRCCVPPLVEKTGFYDFFPSEAGYDELRRFFDYCKDTGLVGPSIKGRDDSGAVQKPGSVEICVIDADDLLDDPEGILRQYCESIDMEFKPNMLNWNDEDQKVAKEAFEKWNGFHEDAIDSTDLKPRQHKKAPKSEEQLYAEWTEKYGQKAADVIQQTVHDNVADYEYLKQYAIKPVNV